MERSEGEKGVLYVEAAISLTAFMFMMFTLLSLTQIAYVQSRMSVALCCATKQVAEYANVYFITEMNKTFNSKDGKSSEIFQEIGGFVKNVGSDVASLDSELGSFVVDAGQATANTSLTQLIKNFGGEGLVLQLMKQNLGDGTKSGYDRFEKHNRIEKMDLMDSTVLPDDSNKISFSVKYDIKVIKLLNLDYTFHLCTWSYADAWSGK